MHDVSPNKSGDSIIVAELEASMSSLDGKEESIRDEGKNSSYQDLLRNWPLMSTIFVYCVFSLQEIAYSEVSCHPSEILAFNFYS